MASEKDKEEVIPVGPGAEEEIHGEEDEREESAGKAEASGDDDERVGHEDDADDPDRESIRARRRDEKRRKKENYKRDRLELNFLRQRNEALERRQSEIEARQNAGDVNSIDQRIGALDDQIRQAEEIHAAAVTKGDGASASEALKIRDDLRDGRQQLRGLKGQTTQRAREAAARPNAPDPQIVERANEWMEDNDWFDPQLRDEDSRIARTIEDGLYNEGRLDARSDEYWEEYEKRLKKRLPEKFESRGNGNDKDEEDEPEERRARGPRITTGGRERPLKKNEVYISAERKAAMVEAGVWDDAKLRDKFLKQYSKYDREHGRNRH